MCQTRKKSLSPLEPIWRWERERDHCHRRHRGALRTILSKGCVHAELKQGSSSSKKKGETMCNMKSNFFDALHPPNITHTHTSRSKSSCLLACFCCPNLLVWPGADFRLQLLMVAGSLVFTRKSQSGKWKWRNDTAPPLKECCLEGVTSNKLWTYVWNDALSGNTACGRLRDVSFEVEDLHSKKKSVSNSSPNWKPSTRAQISSLLFSVPKLLTPVWVFWTQDM